MLIGGGVIFVVWLIVYVILFLSFFLVMILVFVVLFFCLVGFEYCVKIDLLKWCNVWDWVLFIGGFVFLLIFGVVFGNLL